MGRWWVWSAVIWVLLLRMATAAPAERALIVRGRLLDVHDGQLHDRQAVLIRNKHIVAVGAQATVAVPADARVIDLPPNTTMMPGLIDCHTHLTDDAEAYAVAGPLQRSGAQMAFGAIPHAKATLLAGFTTVRDVGTYRAFVDVALRDAINEGIVPGPHMLCAGAYVTITGGAGAITGLAPDIVLPRELTFGVADGADQVRQRVRDIIRHGANLIKILATGAVLTPNSVPGAQEFTYEEMRAAVEEAGHAGLKVACHAHGAAGAKDAIRAGVASIEHGSFLDEEALRMMKERGTFLVPDLYDDEIILNHPPAGYPTEFMQKERQAGESQRNVVRRAIAMGVKIAFGTDAAVIPHGDNGKQFATYVRVGFTPLHAIQTATINAAELLGWSDRVGDLKVGYFGDLIAVRGNPLANVSTLEKPVLVVKEGVVYRNDL